MKYELHHGDCREVMAQMPDNSVDAIVTDPPYGLSFMGKGWDHGVPGVEFWAEALRVAKPGAHLLAFGGTRTFHRLACAIEDAGWEIRDTVGWIYGSGFPKSLDVSKAIAKAAGAEREVLSTRAKRGALGGVAYAQDSWTLAQSNKPLNLPITAPATDAARQWAGWGTALKPAWEPVIVARKPLIGTVAENVLTHGTGAINVDRCRVGTDEGGTNCNNRDGSGKCKGHLTANRSLGGGVMRHGANKQNGRWPANVIHDGSDEATAPFGSAARFFYTAKASKRDRDEGCEGLEERACGTMEDDNYDIKTGSGNSRDTRRRNHHPTVKPTDLMRYLCRLVTPPDGVVLDPFMGSGSTGKAALLEGFHFIGIEREAEYIQIARARIEAVNLGLFG
jgi:DNA modification methylase